MVEAERRHPGFLEGVAIELADGQGWIFPSPSERNLDRLVEEPDYTGLIRAMAEAEDRRELRAAELALMIHLLEVNYDLRPDELQRLVPIAFGSPGAARIREAFHRVARAHLERCRVHFTPPERGAEDRRARSWLGSLTGTLARLFPWRAWRTVCGKFTRCRP